jgi:uncharacterized protein
MQTYHEEAFENPGYRLNVLVDVTNRCQLDCGYCYYGQKGKKDMDVARTTASIQKLFDAIGHNTPNGVQAVHVQMMGGEPLVAQKKMFQLVDTCQDTFSDKAAFSWGLTSNLFDLDHVVAQKVIERSGRIHASFDGPADIQDRNRPRIGGLRSSHKVFAHIPNALTVSQYDTARITVGPQDAHRLDEICQFAFEQGYLYVGPFPATNLDWSENDIRAWGESFRRAILLVLDKYPEGNIRTLIKMGKRTTQKAWAYCGGGRTLFAIGVNGNLHMCHHLTNHENGIDLSHLSADEVFDQIMTSDVVPRSFGHPERCMSCAARVRCNGGGCWAENRESTGDPEKPSDINCAIRRVTHQIIEDLPHEIQLRITEWDKPTPAESQRAHEGKSPWGVITGCDPCDCEDGSSYCEGSCVACNTMC